MTRIYKKQIQGHICFLPLPFGNKILKVGEQDGELYVWYMFEERHITNPEVTVFFVFGTGWELEVHDVGFDVRTREYIDTVQMKNGLVWHVFMGI